MKVWKFLACLEADVWVQGQPSQFSEFKFSKFRATMRDPVSENNRKKVPNNLKWSSNYIIGCISNENEISYYDKSPVLHVHINCSSIHNSQETEMTWVLIS